MRALCWKTTYMIMANLNRIVSIDVQGYHRKNFATIAKNGYVLFPQSMLCVSYRLTLSGMYFNFSIQ